MICFGFSFFGASFFFLGFFHCGFATRMSRRRLLRLLHLLITVRFILTSRIATKLVR